MASVDDLWLVDCGEPCTGEPAAYRPALILGPPDAFGPAFPLVIVAPLITTRHGLSLHAEVEMNAETGLEITSYVQCDLSRSVNRRRLIHHLGTVSPDVSSHVVTVVKTLLNH